MQGSLPMHLSSGGVERGPSISNIQTFTEIKCHLLSEISIGLHALHASCAGFAQAPDRFVKFLAGQTPKRGILNKRASNILKPPVMA